MRPEKEQPSKSYRHQVAERRGGPEILVLAEQPLREVAPGEVRVRVEAAGVLLADVMWQQGKVPGGPKPPFTPGYDVIGRVEEVAGEVGGAIGKDGLTAPSLGDRVAALIGTGGYSEVAYVPVDAAVKVPEGVEPDAAAAVATGYLTGYAITSRLAGLDTGQSILVHAGAGATGSAILDVARLLGLRAFATASPAKLDVVRSFAAEAIDYHSEDFVEHVLDATAGQGVDLVVDPIGGRNLQRSSRALRRGGLLVSTAAISAIMGGEGRLSIVASMARMALWRFGPSRKRGILFDVLRYYGKRPAEYRHDLDLLLGHVAAGRLQPLVAARFSLPEAADAQRFLLERRASGKVILEPRSVDDDRP
jgi:NADPH:quinone reductase-like Zn-dependent oxidoreductase